MSCSDRWEFALKMGLIYKGCTIHSLKFCLYFSIFELLNTFYSSLLVHCQSVDNKLCRICLCPEIDITMLLTFFWDSSMCGKARNNVSKWSSNWQAALHIPRWPKSNWTSQRLRQCLGCGPERTRLDCFGVFIFIDLSNSFHNIASFQLCLYGIILIYSN